MVDRIPRARRGEPTDRGETLVELLVTIAVMGIAVVVVLGAIVTTIMLSATHRKQSAAGADVRAFAEAVESVVAGSPTAYQSCATATTYQTIYTAPAGYTATVTGVRYWNTATSSFSGTCGTDSGVQQVALKVATTDGKVAETLNVTIRRPCRSTTDFPQDTACS